LKLKKRQDLGNPEEPPLPITFIPKRDTLRGIGEFKGEGLQCEGKGITGGRKKTEGSPSVFPRGKAKKR